MLKQANSLGSNFIDDKKIRIRPRLWHWLQPTAGICDSRRPISVASKRDRHSTEIAFKYSAIRAMMIQTVSHKPVAMSHASVQWNKCPTECQFNSTENQQLMAFRWVRRTLTLDIQSKINSFFCVACEWVCVCASCVCEISGSRLNSICSNIRKRVLMQCYWFACVARRAVTHAFLVQSMTHPSCIHSFHDRRRTNCIYCGIMFFISISQSIKFTIKFRHKKRCWIWIFGHLKNIYRVESSTSSAHQTDAKHNTEHFIDFQLFIRCFNFLIRRINKNVFFSVSFNR